MHITSLIRSLTTVCVLSLLSLTSFPAAAIAIVDDPGAAPVATVATPENKQAQAEPRKAQPVGNGSRLERSRMPSQDHSATRSAAPVAPDAGDPVDAQR